MEQDAQAVERTADIVRAYVKRNTVDVETLPDLIKDVYGALVDASSANGRDAAAKPAVPVKASVTQHYLICLEDGRKFKSLKRHLQSQYELTPEAYRAKWGLPADYPMVAPSYARRRSELARKMGLGKKGR
ncbi:MAG: MucR family transcriptional regulator [Pseudomonadota bacterium]